MLPKSGGVGPMGVAKCWSWWEVIDTVLSATQLELESVLSEAVTIHQSAGLTD